MQSCNKEDCFVWCRREANNLGLSTEQRYGGLMFDEMTIQENVRFARIGGKYKITGFVNLGVTHEDYNVLINGKLELGILEAFISQMY